MATHDAAGHDADAHPATTDAPAHDHPHAHGRLGWLREAIPFLHGHSHGAGSLDAALEGSARGLWALKVSLLGLAFVLGRRAADRRYTYGYGRAEDLTGVAIVAAYESAQKLSRPQPLSHLGWVMAAAVVGFLGNEAVARFRIRVGRAIGSAALVADGEHARVDGFTSLAVLAGALGVLAGFPLADPIVGLLITLAILVIVKDTALVMWRRLMDAVDPAIVDRLEGATAGTPGVERVETMRARWLGHRLGAEVRLVVNEDLPTRESHRVAEEVRHALFHEQPRLACVTVHVDPCGHGGADPHALTAHHLGQHGVLSVDAAHAQ